MHATTQRTKTMRITLDKKVQQELQKTSKLTGLREQELAERAILLYLDSMRSMTNLTAELRAWQELSGESLRLFEVSLTPHT